MYRSIGRMFIICSAEELQDDLKNDIGGLDGEATKIKTMKDVLNTKKETLTKQLNDLTPKDEEVKKE